MAGKDEIVLSISYMSRVFFFAVSEMTGTSISSIIRNVTKTENCIDALITRWGGVTRSKHTESIGKIHAME